MKNPIIRIRNKDSRTVFEMGLREIVYLVMYHRQLWTVDSFDLYLNNEKVDEPVQTQDYE